MKTKSPRRSTGRRMRLPLQNCSTRTTCGVRRWLDAYDTIQSSNQEPPVWPGLREFRAARENHSRPEHPGGSSFQTIEGDVGLDRDAERIATDRLFDLLDVMLPEGMPKYKRTPEAQNN